ncbi:hypothetical protein [Acetobacter oryzifermentans]|uniref:Uncharacterized protein n=1 Tax=Acetobacter oryzifermentans TaxID=1633874 RepID=A0ABM6AK78_9PROT|nr:hypothetical protein [Acetobacter oryzifermentans]ANA14154.1 hypothetical protein WG31_09175 [Acetobacter oryzifermentans]
MNVYQHNAERRASAYGGREKTMIKMSKTVRAAIITQVSDSAEYDASTVRISRNGEVTAKKDQNKTSSYDNARYLVGYIENMV